MALVETYYNIGRYFIEKIKSGGNHINTYKNYILMHKNLIDLKVHVVAIKHYTNDAIFVDNSLLINFAVILTILRRGFEELKKRYSSFKDKAFGIISYFLIILYTQVPRKLKTILLMLTVPFLIIVFKNRILVSVQLSKPVKPENLWFKHKSTGLLSKTSRS